MSRAPVFPVEEKGPVVLSIVAGEVSVAEVARRAKVSEPSVGNWKRQFLEARRAGLVAGRAGPTTREAHSWRPRSRTSSAPRTGVRHCTSQRARSGACPKLGPPSLVDLPGLGLASLTWRQRNTTYGRGTPSPWRAKRLRCG